EENALQSNSPVSFNSVTQELTFSGLILKFWFLLLILVVLIPLATGLLTPQQKSSMGKGFASVVACIPAFLCGNTQNVLIHVTREWEASP
ncbi:unnamed protein product, partial [Bubo scandiacus]